MLYSNQTTQQTNLWCKNWKNDQTFLASMAQNNYFRNLYMQDQKFEENHFHAFNKSNEIIIIKNNTQGTQRTNLRFKVAYAAVHGHSGLTQLQVHAFKLVLRCESILKLSVNTDTAVCLCLKFYNWKAVTHSQGVCVTESESSTEKQRWAEGREASVRKEADGWQVVMRETSF